MSYSSFLSCRIMFFIPFFILAIYFNKICLSNKCCLNKNVGTVLFTESDMTKDCWATEGIALLTSRMLLEDVLPSPEHIIVRDNTFITDIVDYFRLVLETVRQLTYGKTKHILLLALTDALGGYLNKYVLPIAKHAFYAGYIDFDSMDKLHHLFNELKCFLRTNGHGWAKPIRALCRAEHIQCLPTHQPTTRCDPCKGIILSIQYVSDGSVISKVPLPFMDSKSSPTAIAVPFKTYSLRNIESKSASYVLVKYYITAMKCLCYRNVSRTDISEFNGNLYTWIYNNVLPHLSDEKFYSAFGGVLRIIATLKGRGAKPTNDKEMGSYNIMPQSELPESKEPEEEYPKQKKSSLLLTVLLATIFIWFLLGSIFICYRIKAAKNNKCECPNEEEPLEQEPQDSKTSLSKKQPTESSKSSQSNKSTTTASTKKTETPSVCSDESCPKKTRTSSSATLESSSKERQRNVSEKGSKASRARSSKTRRSTGAYACHTSITANYDMNSSSDDANEPRRRPFVFGYDLETSASELSLPRGQQFNRRN